tara:strand:- start:225 stop:500 length:276 start_codon:yes stop_codon:yes gene_type:complete
MNLFFVKFFDNNFFSLAAILTSLLGRIIKKILEQVEGFALRVVELLFKVSMLPLYALVLFQHANNQQMLSPVAYPLYAGDKITVFLKRLYE